MLREVIDLLMNLHLMSDESVDIIDQFAVVLVENKKKYSNDHTSQKHGNIIIIYDKYWNLLSRLFNHFSKSYPNYTTTTIHF